MAEQRQADSTTILRVFNNWNDASAARDFLIQEGIDSVIVADEVHPSVQVTGGVRLLVLGDVAERARAVIASMDIPAGAVDVGKWTDGISRGTVVGAVLLLLAYLALIAFALSAA